MQAVTLRKYADRRKNALPRQQMRREDKIPRRQRRPGPPTTHSVRGRGRAPECCCRAMRCEESMDGRDSICSGVLPVMRTIVRSTGGGCGRGSAPYAPRTFHNLCG